MNKVTLLAMIALTMIGSLVFRAWQRTPVAAVRNSGPQRLAAAATTSLADEEFRARLRRIIAKAKAAVDRDQEKAQTGNKSAEADAEKSSVKEDK